MQYIWQFRLYPTRDTVTTTGHRIEVLEPGLHNHDAGPDFFNAKLLIDRQEWIGNIEIHVRASDWYRHGHDKDKAYDNVVLHVVAKDDAEVYRSNGEKIPQMTMQCSPDFANRYHEMVNNPFRELPCGNEIKTLPTLYINDWLSALAFERLYEKVDRIHNILQANNYDWATTVYITMARAMGFSTNSEPFELLARTTPLKAMLHHTDSLLSVEAILFGQAGMLNGLDPAGDPYLTRLIDEYRFLKAKYNLTPSPNISWKMSKMRPTNSPHRRIAALAQMISANNIFNNRLIEVSTEKQARELLNIKLRGFWATHYNFGSQATATTANAFSNASKDILLINVVVPLIFAYSLNTGNDKRQEFAIDLMQSLSPESNRIVDIYIRAGLQPLNAFDSQAMIQLKRNYCDQRKCLYCRLGHRLLSAKVKP